MEVSNGRGSRRRFSPVVGRFVAKPRIQEGKGHKGQKEVYNLGYMVGGDKKKKEEVKRGNKKFDAAAGEGDR